MSTLRPVAALLALLGASFVPAVMAAAQPAEGVAEGAAKAATEEVIEALPIDLSSAGGVDEGLPGIAGVPSAGEVEPGSMRVVMQGSFFRQADFAESGGTLSGLGSSIGLGYGVIPSLTVGGRLSAASHSGSAMRPRDLQALGDSSVMAAWVPLRGKRFAAGTRVGAAFFSGTEPFSGYAETASPFADLLASGRFGFLRAHLQTGFFLDRSEGLLAEGTVLDPAQRAAYGVADGPHLRTGLALEAPLFSGRLTPFAAWKGRMWTGEAAGDDAHVVAGGLRWAIPAHGRAFALDAGLDYALSGDQPDPARPVTPTMRAMVGISLLAPQTRSVVRVIRQPVQVAAAPIPPPAPVTGEIRGSVRDEASGEPLAWAIVDVPGRAANPILTDASGSFRLGELPSGPLKLRAQKSGYGIVTQDVTVVAGQSATVEVALSTAAVKKTGAFAGEVKAASGAPLPATITLGLGTQTRTISADAAGKFTAALPPGVFKVTVVAKGFVAQTKTIEIKPGEQTVFNFLLAPSAP